MVQVTIPLAQKMTNSPCPSADLSEQHLRLRGEGFAFLSLFFFLRKHNLKENILLITFITELNKLTLKFQIEKTF